MPRKSSTPPPPPERLRLTKPRTEAEQLIQKQITAAGEELIRSLEETPTSLEALITKRQLWSDYTIELLKVLFTTDELSERFQGYGFGGTWDSDPQKHFKNLIDDITERLQNLRSLRARLELIEEISAPTKMIPVPLPLDRHTGESKPQSHDVFVVHGRDESSKQAVARFLEKLGLHPIILHEQPDKGQTIIQKFEDHSDVGFAVVLLTADDEGRLRGSHDDLRFRARQNVILELGYFLGRLGRSQVCALKADGVEEPSDFHGVLYVPMDSGDGWKVRLAKELKAAGFDIDMNRI
jgi:predicted nucleotide-binding protein